MIRALMIGNIVLAIVAVGLLMLTDRTRFEASHRRAFRWVASGIFVAALVGMGILVWAGAVKEHDGLFIFGPLLVTLPTCLWLVLEGEARDASERKGRK